MQGRRILLVADRSATGPHIRHVLLARHANGPCHVTLLVPAGPPSRTWTWDEAQVRHDAHRRMIAAVTSLRRYGIDVHGVLGDSSPMQAIRDALDRFPYDEIIISTLPAKISRWLRRDLPTRAARSFGIPVTHIGADAEVDEWRGGRANPAA